METTVKMDFSRSIAPIKPMNAVNNGPIRARSTQARGNFDAFRAADIPFVRTHDASFCSFYGGEHTVDISAVFPDFDSDANNPASYDFTLTDEYLSNIMDAGSEVFFRLGSKIEHAIKKYGTLPPKDFHKWAVVCEHIIRHFNEGWADGHFWNIQYWEIWNEPDLKEDDSDNKPTWGGTAVQFYEFYRITATHLKTCFPHLKIGGPSLARNFKEWAENFLTYLTSGNEPVPLDFFSWHIYTTDPKKVSARAEFVRERLDFYGYNKSELILNEWNYVEGWNEEFIRSIEAIIGLKGSAFTMACMIEGQNSPIDMLMYYDARPCSFNGLFDFHTFRPLKGYYPFVIFSTLKKQGEQVECSCDDNNIYALATAGKDGNAAAVCYYAGNNETDNRDVVIGVKGLSDSKLTCYLLDETHNLENVGTVDVCAGTVRLTMTPNSTILLKSI